MGSSTPEGRILLVEDDPAIRFGVELNLGREGYEVLSAVDGAAGLEAARKPGVDLVILDLLLPKLPGLEVLRRIREEGVEVPIIILSALGQEGDKVRGLELGADDYLGKPFGVAELLARVKAALRRRRGFGAGEPALIVMGEVEIDPVARVVRRAGAVVELTPRELELLLLFAASPGRVLERQRILDRVWGYDYEGTERTVDNFVASLRKKLEQDPEHPRLLKTVRGMGYRFEGE